MDKITEDRIKAAANVVDVISDFYELHKNGQNYTCLCPFHNDRHLGSFIVSEAKNIYSCFSCGAKGDAIEFVRQHEHLSYGDALLWLAKKYGIDAEGADKFHPSPAKPRPAAPQLPVLDLGLNMPNSRLDTSEDTLCNWLRSLPWTDEQMGRVEVVLHNYKVGHARQGHTIFWQIDEEAHVRTGKMMLYKNNGHRDRETPGNFHWIHNLLDHAGKIDLNKVRYETTFFGMHLLNVFPDADIHLVESEKTALICAIIYGDMMKNIWIACGGKTFLTRQRMKPLIDTGRRIILYPDKDGMEEWEAAVNKIGYSKMMVNKNILNRYWKPEDGPKADIADIFVRMMTENQFSPTMTRMMERNPALRQLVDKLKLVEE